MAAARIALPLALVLALAPALARAEDECGPVQGTVTTTFAPPTSCASPVGVCTVGTIAAGPLTGTTAFTATSIVVRGPFQVFTGVFTVATATGTATYATSGVVDGRTGRYVEQFQLTSGTGAFQGARSALASTGFVTPTGFTGAIDGALCAR